MEHPCLGNAPEALMAVQPQIVRIGAVWVFDCTAQTGLQNKSNKSRHRHHGALQYGQRHRHGRLKPFQYNHLKI